MRIPLAAKLDPRQNPDDSRGLVLSTPTITAPTSDDDATVVELNGTEHRVPRGWQIAEGKHGESDIAILRQGSTVKVLAGDREGRIHEVIGYSASLRRSILEHRFGETPQQTAEDREVTRIAALSAESISPNNGSDDAEVDRLVKLSDTMDGSSSDDAEAERLAKMAEGLA